MLKNYVSLIKEMKNMRTFNITRFIFGLLIVGPGLIGASGGTLAQAGLTSDDARFCANAQALIAQVDVVADAAIHETYEAFVDSKVVAYPLEVQQFNSNPQEGTADLFKVVSCKMRTAGSIVDAYAEQGEILVPGEETSCEFLISTMLSEIGEETSMAKLSIDLASVAIDEEDLTFMGPSWLDPWPFEPADMDESGTLHLKSRALYVPWSIFIPAPAAFKGVYYCHLPAPAYLKALLEGSVKAPLRE
jgi:hypothetical protein